MMTKSRFNAPLQVITMTLMFGWPASSQGEEPAPLRQPIGHSLQTPEAKRRIEGLMAQGETREQAFKATVDRSRADQPLQNGKYGFAEPPPLQGVPKAFVSLGATNPAYGIVVEKLHHRLTIFKLNEQHKYEVVKTFRAITGKDPGDKVSRGDLRTPEGIYFITGRMSDDQLPAKYGRMALTLDYPNIYDRRVRKSGSGIWIHATDDPSRLLRPYDTEGCVAVSNEDIVKIAEYVQPFETPVVITKEMTTATEQEIQAPREGALKMIESWRHSWEKSDFKAYMEFYSPNFITLGKKKQDWQKFKNMLSSRRGESIQIGISEPKIIAFENQLLAVFMQNYKSSEHSDFGRKFLYLQWEGDSYRIIAEKWYRSGKTDTAFRDFKPM
jgi:murein L,D-transpeptidase YafK